METVYRKFKGAPSLWHRAGGNGHGKLCRDPAAAAAQDLLFVGVIQIDQARGRHLAHVKVLSTGKIILLRRGEQHLQCGVAQGVVVQHRHGHGHADAIVGTQGGPSAGGQDVTVQLPVDGVLHKVVLCFRRLFTHHVHVGLKHDPGGTLVSRGSGLADQDIQLLVLLCLQPPFPGPAEQKLTDLLFVLAGAGDVADDTEKAKHRMVAKGLCGC